MLMMNARPTLARTSGKYTLYARPAYFDTLAKEIAATKSGDRVLVTSMTLRPQDDLVQTIITSLCEAASRGVIVHFSIDAHQFLSYEFQRLGPLWFHKDFPEKMSPPFARKYATLEKLYRAGVHVGVTNQPHKRFTSPFAGRSHIKTAIINEKLYIGGCNLSASDQLDVMVSWHDKTSADWLYNLMHSMVVNESSLDAFGMIDHQYAINKKALVLIDTGVRDQSIILRQALKVIDDAEEWLLITCQYFPNSITAQALKRAQLRGVKVFPIFNNPRKHGFPHSVLQYAVAQRERLRMPREFFLGELPPTLPFLHAKVLASEQQAMVGSHNYVRAGVALGTAETALWVKDAAFAQASAQFILELTQLTDDARFAFLRHTPRAT
jgi:cardiolipin synthase